MWNWVGKHSRQKKQKKTKHEVLMTEREKKHSEDLEGQRDPFMQKSSE